MGGGAGVSGNRPAGRTDAVGGPLMLLLMVSPLIHFVWWREPVENKKGNVANGTDAGKVIVARD